MTNRIIIELSSEDRARIDALIAALAKRVEQETPLTVKIQDPIQQRVAEVMATAVDPIEPPKVEAPTPEPTKEEEPTITQDQIQQKVTYLVAFKDGAHKADVKKIVNLYSATVSGIPEEKYPECWAKLNELEVSLK